MMRHRSIAAGAAQTFVPAQHARVPISSWSIYHVLSESDPACMKHGAWVGEVFVRRQSRG
ncbi:hypothetical protein CBOM_07696 [Ceraceosorus bombacis]|uniref:Uncharacterized protein n=1 Tax=Ceraceosorus bombacis TaxID=401625 RepID=A0A0P1BHR7_9BASI|nr:hypothetical protein CBOM_07696 [Ceraceosorus bombacis]